MPFVGDTTNRTPTNGYGMALKKMHLINRDGQWSRSFWALPIRDAERGFLHRVYSSYIPPTDATIIFEGWEYTIANIEQTFRSRVSVELSVLQGSTRFLELEG